MNQHGANCLCPFCTYTRQAQAEPIQWQPIGEAATWHSGARYPAMTAADLGIVDQLLDDKVGMDLP